MKFNINRFMNLMKRDFVTYKKPILFGVIGFVGLVTLIAYLTVKAEDHVDYGIWLNWFGILFFGAGLLFTTVVFWEFKSPASRLQYLKLPASNFEKFLSRWMYSLILVPGFIGLTVWVAATITAVPGSLHREDEIVPILIKVFILAHSVLFMFAIMYNRYTAPKTVISLFGIWVVTMTLGALIFRIVFNQYFDGWSFNDHNMSIQPNDEMGYFVEHKLFPVFKKLVWVVVPLFFWVVSYFKMKEKEA